MHTVTDEQQGIIHSQVARLKVQAFAGTGKTETANLFIEARPRSRFLYLVFNKSAQLEARNRFRHLPNVKTQTTHGLAYRLIGHRFRGKLTGSLRNGHVQAAIDPNGRMNYRSRMLIAAVVSAFLKSSDHQITSAHVQAVMPPDAGVSVDQIRDLAEQLWVAMSDPNNSRVAMTHDGYLKLLQLAGVDLSPWFDYIVIDEAQDINPLVAAILNHQRLPQLFIGDSHQSIYRFRGAINALEEVQTDQSLTLTCAFRYGPELAILASQALAHHKNEDDLIIGYGDTTAIRQDEPQEPPFTRVHRTFAECFRSAFLALESRQHVHWLGGMASYPLDDLANLYHLKHAQWSCISSPHLLREFPSYQAYRETAKQVDDPEMLRLVRLIEEFDTQIPSLVDRMKAYSVPARDADCIITTAHRAKGLQWDRVELANDFPDWHDTRVSKPERDDEINLAYVAITRARRSLSLSATQYRQLTTAPPAWSNRTSLRRQHP